VCCFAPAADAILNLSRRVSAFHFRRAGTLLLAASALISALYAWQKPFKEYPGVEYSHYPIPPDPMSLPSGCLRA